MCGGDKFPHEKHIKAARNKAPNYWGLCCGSNNKTIYSNRIWGTPGFQHLKSGIQGYVQLHAKFMPAWDTWNPASKYPKWREKWPRSLCALSAFNDRDKPEKGGWMGFAYGISFSSASCGAIPLGIQGVCVWKDSVAPRTHKNRKGPGSKCTSKGTRPPPKASIPSQQYHQLHTNAFNLHLAVDTKMQTINYTCIHNFHRHIVHFYSLGLSTTGCKGPTKLTFS